MYPATTEPRRRPWHTIRHWVIWLDGPRLEQISSSSYELAVIDYSADGSAEGAFTAAQVDTLRQRPCQRRVVAYLSIGEAEDYRWYWQRGWHTHPPAWLVEPDADWQGNYWVRYWDPRWQHIIYRSLDQIIAAGFDGIYLDRVDAYEAPYAVGHEQEMVRLVTALADYARRRSPLGKDFGIFVQNAEGLAANYPNYVALLTGIGKEELYIRATNLPTPASERANAEALLDRFRQRSQGHLVLTVDYADRPDLMRIAYEQARARGYVPYVADVALNQMRLNPGYEPVCQPIADHSEESS